jgi:NAD(P)-dependent dehydrogenase (short-subunit alcohol dehydrogenase family)
MFDWASFMLGLCGVPTVAFILLRLAHRVLSTRYKVMEKGSAVVVTGSSTGIGRAMATWLASQGMVVFATVRRSDDAAALNAVKSEKGGCIIPLMMDVAKPETVAAAVVEVEKTLKERNIKGISCLINNAGVSESQPTECLNLDVLRRVMEVNFVGVVDVTQRFLPLLRQSESARIVNISSISGRIATPFNTIYCSSKFALEAMSDCLRRELVPWKIAVVLIEPGYIRTPIQEKGLALQENVFDSLHSAVRGFYKGYYTDAAIQHRYRSNVEKG